MNGELYQITVEQMGRLLAEADIELTIHERATTEYFAKYSDPLLAGMYGPELVCLVGLIPVTAVSSSAYLWHTPTNAVAWHKTKFGRYVRRWLHSDKIPYNQLNGHCLVVDQNGINWVKWLGAEFGEAQGPLIPFTIRRG